MRDPKDSTTRVGSRMKEDAILTLWMTIGIVISFVGFIILLVVFNRWGWNAGRQFEQRWGHVASPPEELEK